MEDERFGTAFSTVSHGCLPNDAHRKPPELPSKMVMEEYNDFLKKNDEILGGMVQN